MSDIERLTQAASGSRRTTPKSAASGRYVSGASMTRALRATSQRNRFTVLITGRISNAAAALGSQSDLAQWIGVSRSQTTRWSKGETAPSPEAERAITDLDFIVARARMVWDDEVIPDWLHGHNAFLSGATPLEMIRRGRTAEVLEAISSEAAGVYA